MLTVPEGHADGPRSLAGFGGGPISSYFGWSYSDIAEYVLVETTCPLLVFSNACMQSQGALGHYDKSPHDHYRGAEGCHSDARFRGDEGSYMAVLEKNPWVKALV